MPRVSDQPRYRDDDLSDDDPLLRAVSRVPRAERALEQVAIPTTLSLHIGQPLVEQRSPLPEPAAVVDGRYRIDERLGSGGMGVVFAATHLHTKKRVALKWMHAGSRLRSASEQVAARRRFEREARIAARVRHENVVDVYDAGGDAHGAYLVMELLQGETLAARLARGPLAWSEALELLVPAMRGVAALHAQGVVHRDLKPENIYLTRAASGAFVPKVLDFGVASLRDAEQDEADQTLTRPGSILGTPGYMPLEQLRGERTLDARTDVYALGVVLYEALVGKRPIGAGNAAEHAARLASERPRPIAALLPELRGPRSDAVMKALARERDDRYPSVEAMIDALTQARPDRWGRPGLVLSAAALTLGAAAAGLALLASVPDQQPHRGRSAARAPRVEVQPRRLEVRMASPTPAALDGGSLGAAIPRPSAQTEERAEEKPQVVRPKRAKVAGASPAEPRTNVNVGLDRATSLSRDDF